MARSRNIKPSFFTNDVLAECCPLARLLFAGLWTLADREGRLEDRPKKIKAQTLPYDDCDMESLLDELEVASFITRYEIDGNYYIQIANFTKHQIPHYKETASTIPAPKAMTKTSALVSKINTESDDRSMIDQSSTNDRSTKVQDFTLNLNPSSPIPHPESLIRNPESGIPLPQTQAEGSDLIEAMEIYNEMARTTGLPKCATLTKQRKSFLRCRLKESGGMEGWRHACKTVSESAFLTGQNDKGWKASFDFMLQQSSFTKIMEGTYATNAPPKKARHDPSLETARSLGLIP